MNNKQKKKNDAHNFKSINSFEKKKGVAQLKLQVRETNIRMKKEISIC